MVNEELINNIKARFQQGEKTSEIKDGLLNEGWSEGDIDAAFSQIRHEALMQIPVYAKITNWMHGVDSKASQLPTNTVVKIFIGISLLFIGAVALLYYFVDPLGFRTAERDKQREETAISLRQSLDKYYKDQQSYPAKLSQLVPKYIAAEPVDPKSKRPLDYKAFDNNSNYEFCIEFELQALQCITSTTASDIPVVETQPAEPTRPLEPVQFGINGQIFMDDDEDGSKSEEELGAENVPVKITNNALEVQCETTTDSSGIFNCNVPGEGQYSVQFTFPQGYANPGGNPVIVTLPSESNIPNVETLFIGLLK